MEIREIDMSLLLKQGVSDWIFIMEDENVYIVKHIMKEIVRIEKSSEGEVYAEIILENAVLPRKLFQSITSGVRLKQLVQSADYRNLNGDYVIKSVFEEKSLSIKTIGWVSGDKELYEDFTDPDVFHLYITTHNLLELDGKIE